ncbi:MAG: T9SS type A sorting domain-containing protein [Phaeodactylibacter sp.]|nr:T9SS type A sorting domain-containing protein [Phaeodactylibacter sp.]
MKKFLLFSLCCLLSSLSQAQLQLNWTTPIDVAPASFGNDYPRIVLNGEQQPMITWGSNKKVYFTRFFDAGFLDPLQLNDDTTNAYVASWTGPDLVARNDTIYAGFMHEQWHKKTYIVRSFDNGQSFSAPLLVENYPDSASRFPTVAIDQLGNPVVAVMKMGLNEQDPHYVLRKSFDYGTSFTAESTVGGWSGVQSQACDCCPAAVTAEGANLAVVYRDNLNNVRDIWAAVSTDNGQSIEQGFTVDDNHWQISACPSSGPDAVLIGDTLCSVFLSGNACYLSRTSISTGILASVVQLGALPVAGNQNFPRIDRLNKQVVITWRGSAGINKYLHLAYTDDITNGAPFLQDTVYTGNFSAADVALGAEGVHVAMEDITGTVKYMHGTFSSTAVDVVPAASISIFPNPCADLMHIDAHGTFGQFAIYRLDGSLVQRGVLESPLDVSPLPTGSYILELLDADKRQVRQLFVKN